MNIGNPLLATTRNLALSPTDSVTVNGVINKTAFMMLALLATFGYTWHLAASGSNVTPWMVGGAIAGLVLALVIIFSKSSSPFLILPYALCEGLFLGGISAYYEQLFPGIVQEAVLLTLTCFGGILFAYKINVIRYSPGFARFLSVAILGILFAYIISIVGSFFGFPLSFLHDSSPLSIAISLFIVGIATLSFIIDFEAIKQAVNQGVEKKKEWYFAFALLVSLIWLYLEILRLLSKLRKR